MSALVKCAAWLQRLFWDGPDQTGLMRVCPFVKEKLETEETVSYG